MCSLVPSAYDYAYTHMVTSLEVGDIKLTIVMSVTMKNKDMNSK